VADRCDHPAGVCANPAHQGIGGEADREWFAACRRAVAQPTRPAVLRPMVDVLGPLPPGDDHDLRVLAEAREVLARHRHSLGASCTVSCPPTPGSRPLCDQQLPVDCYPTRTALRCDLPAGHHSEEHYDRASGLVWLHDRVQPRPHPDLDWIRRTDFPD
jgi:hypothetical protein